jgi:hypothetical protein
MNSLKTRPAPSRFDLPAVVAVLSLFLDPITVLFILDEERRLRRASGKMLRVA